MLSMRPAKNCEGVSAEPFAAAWAKAVAGQTTVPDRAKRTACLRRCRLIIDTHWAEKGHIGLYPILMPMIRTGGLKMFFGNQFARIVPRCSGKGRPITCGNRSS